MVSTLSKNYYPSDVLKSMKQNAHPRMALKLMQICKYFQHPKFPYFVVEYLVVSSERASYIPLEKNESSEFAFVPLKFIDKIEDIPEGLWILKELKLINIDFSLISYKIECCEITVLSLQRQILSLQEFKILSKNLAELWMTESFIKYENGEVVVFEDLLECVPNIESINLDQYIPSIVNLEKANSLFIPQNVEMKLKIDENFNVAFFTSFLLNHQNIYANIETVDKIRFDLRLQNFVDEIIKNWCIKFRPPSISFLNQTESSSMTMKDMAREYRYVNLEKIK